MSKDEIETLIYERQQVMIQLDKDADPQHYGIGIKEIWDIDPANLFHAGELPRMSEILDEAFALMEAPGAERLLGLRDRALLEVLYGAGLRVSELAQLRLGAAVGAEQAAEEGDVREERHATGGSVLLVIPQASEDDGLAVVAQPQSFEARAIRAGELGRVRG